MLDPETLMEGLTDAQREAVRHVDGPLLVLAGPGSGKTTVVTRRVAYLIGQGIPAWQVLALTFTNKAAAEMRRRIETRLPEDLPGRRGLTVSTFHSFCVRLLRRFAAEAGLPPRFTIFDAADQRELLKRALARAGLSSKNWSPAAVGGTISNAKNQLLDAKAFASAAGDFYERSVAKAYAEYELLLKDNDALDFDDLLLRTARLLRTNEPVRQQLQRRYQYVLIDEYQDTNHAQFMIAHVLAAEHGNICVVGDPDQSIYGWRGADISNILEFEKQYPSARVVALGQNFRSTAMIVETAAALIANNRRRKSKLLFTELGEGERPTVVTCRDEHAEAGLIVDEMRRHYEQGTSWKQMAVLYRVNALSRVLEEVFRDAAIPYVIARGTAFYERKEVKDALAYLRLVANPADEVSLGRIVNEPPRGIGKTTLQRVETFAFSRQMSMLEAMRRASEIPDLASRAVGAIQRFVEMVDGWRTDAAAVGDADRRGLAGLVERVVRESDLETHYRKSSSRSEELEQRLANLAELVSAAADFTGLNRDDDGGPDGDAASAGPVQVIDQLAEWLESITLVSDADAIDPERGSVTLMTLHTAKGLEFDVVAIAGLEEGTLPHVRAATSDAELEEERRLCFVGITRARRHLLLTRAALRTRRGIRERTVASQFLSELPEQYVTRLDLAGEAYDDPGYDAFDEPWTGSEGGGRLEDGYTVGCLVRHPTFGLGRIQTITSRPRGCAARVAFEEGFVKTLLLEFAGLERVE